jgi:holo-[acyl-carrier protein] synthase
MIIGIGTDILNIERAKAALSRTPGIARRVLTDFELEGFNVSSDQVRYFAKRFAAKEAIVKALGTGIGRGVGWQHIEITKTPAGQPSVVLSDGARRASHKLEVSTIHLSYSDERDYVVAFALAES